jgi:probable F420-dependent oxidoreductase
MHLDFAMTEGSLRSAQADGRRAADAGFSRVWSTETTADPFLQALAAAEAGATDVGTGIAVAFARTPMVTAYLAWDLAAFTGGRFTLGLGTQVKGHIERRYAMPWGQPAARLRDYVAALRAIWQAWGTGEPLAYEGPFYRHTLMTPVFTPQPHEHRIPIGIAAVGELMTELSGEVADVLLVHGFSNVAYVDAVTLPALQRGLDRAGRSRSAVELYSSTFLLMGDTEEQQATMREQARERIAFYGSTPSYLPVLEAIGRGDVSERLQERARAKDWDSMSQLVDDDVLDAFALTGTPEQMPALVKERFEGRLDRVASYYGWPEMEPGRLRDIVAAFGA